MSSSSSLPTPGDFSFVKDSETRQMFEDAYRAIAVAEAWNEVRADPGEGGFMFSSFPKRDIINANIK